MKKLLIGVLIFVLLISVSACGKSEEVKRVEELIDEIGTVSVESQNTIGCAWEAYQLLEDSDKKKVENYHILEKADEEFQQIMFDETVDTLKIAAKQAADLLDHFYNVWDTTIAYSSKLLPAVEVHVRQAADISTEEMYRAMDTMGLIQYSGGELAYETWEYAVELLRDPSYSIFIAWQVYFERGDISALEANMSKVITDIKCLDSDFACYDILVDYYNTINEMYSFIQEPGGTLNELRLLINSSESNVLLCESELEFYAS